MIGVDKMTYYKRAKFPVRKRFESLKGFDGGNKPSLRNIKKKVMQEACFTIY